MGEDRVEDGEFRKGVKWLCWFSEAGEGDEDDEGGSIVSRVVKGEVVIMGAG